MPKEEPPKPAQNVSKRGRQLNLRIDDDLFDAAAGQAQQHGGLSLVIRVLLRKYVAGQVKVTPAEVLGELLSAKKGRKSKIG
jgi:hypothetical protein